MSHTIQCEKGHVFNAPEGSGLDKAAGKYFEKMPNEQAYTVGPESCNACSREKESQEERNRNLEKVERLSGRRR